MNIHHSVIEGLKKTESITMTHTDIINIYSTHDMALATAISLYFPIDAIDNRDPNKVEFQFQRSKELEQVIESYWRNELRVSPQDYFYQLRSLKTRIREAR